MSMGGNAYSAATAAAWLAARKTGPFTGLATIVSAAHAAHTTGAHAHHKARAATTNGGGDANGAANAGGVNGADNTNSAVRPDQSSNTSGGGIAVISGTLTLTNSTVMSNTATGDGGGIESESSPTTLTNSRVVNNTAGGSDGGGIDIFNDAATSPGLLNVVSSAIVSNTAGGNGSGGGIDNNLSQVQVTTSTVAGNSADLGGGLYNFSFSSGTGAMTVANSAVVSNTATSDGGGLNNDITSTLTITNSTISGNSAPVGGGILNFSSTITLTNDTVAGNTATQTGGGIAISNTNSLSTTLTNAILALNSAPAPAAGPDCNGAILSGGHNVLGSVSGGCTLSGGVGDLTNTDPRLGPLQDNGGPTLTRALLPDSPAINLVPLAACAGLTTDQRGFSRPFPPGGACDAGAYEYQPIVLGLSPTSGPTTGGTTVVITGFDLEGATSVTFGGVAAASVTFGGVAAANVITDASGRSVTATSPAHAVGPVDVQVAVTAGSGVVTSTVNPPADTFTYVAPATTNTPVSTGTGTATTAPTSTGTAVPVLALASTGTAVPLTIIMQPKPKPQLSPPVTRRFCIAGGVETSSEHSSLALLNANNSTAHVMVTLYFTDGAVRTSSFTAGANTQRSVTIASLTRGQGAFGLCVAADRAVSGQLNLTRPGKDGDSELGSPALGYHWSLAEGYTGLTFHETVALLNPDARHAATVTLHLLLPGGKGNRAVSEMVGKHNERVVDINGILDKKGTAVSIVADANRPVLVERSLTFSTGGYGLTTRDAAPNAATSWLFAEGSTRAPFQTFLTILNPQRYMARVTASFFGRAGRRLGQRALKLAPRSRATLLVNDIVRDTSSVASVVTSDRPVVVERPAYFGSLNAHNVAGSNVVGRTSAGVSWAVPGGLLASEDSEFLLLYNPSPRAARVALTFYNTKNGGTVTTTVLARAGARYTFDVSGFQRGTRTHPGPPLAASHGAVVRATNGVRIVVEHSVFGRDHSTLQATQGLAQ